MKKIDRRIVIIGALIFIIGLSYGIMRYLIAQKEGPPAILTRNAQRYVNAEVIKYGTVISAVSEMGRMASVSEINLSAEASGKIEQGDIMLKKGAIFKKGDIIFQIYKDEAVLALKAKKSAFLNTLALMLPDISIDFPDHDKEFRNFFNAIEINQALPAFPLVKDEKLNIFLAGRNVLSEFYDIRKDELQLSRHITRAPFDGTLTDVFMEVGAYTNTGGTVARAIRTDELELEVPLSRADAFWVSIGDPVEVMSDIKSFTWNGTVIRKSLVVDENTQSQHVFVRIKNKPDQALLAGEYLHASFRGRPVEETMEITRNAVFNTNEVFLVKNKRLVKNRINIIKVNSNTLLFNGPAAGDTLVVQAMINVFEGTPVTTSLDQQMPPGEFDRSGNDQ